MGVPWQADAASCRFGYVKEVSPVLPTFWSARIPNSVLTAEDYAIVVDTDKSLEDRRAAFGRRANWERYLTTKDSGTVLSLMVQEWFKLGVVRERPGPKDKVFPARMAVESRVGFVGQAPDTPNWYGRGPLSLFPLIVTNSDDNTLRSINSGGAVSDLALQFPFARPEGIASDSMGNLYVAVMDGDSIVRISAAGESTTIASGLPKPLGVACDRWGNVYCCGIGNGGWTAVIRLNGSVTKLITQNSGTFLPVAVAVAPDGALLVADSGSNVIMRFDPLLTKMLNSKWITGLAAPRCMAWDADGNLFVVERSSNSVSKFDPQGRKLPFTLQGIALDGPVGIAFDGDESMYVSSANPTANRVDRIKLNGQIGSVNAFASGLANPSGVVFQGLI
jgi:sugar lactone lactonase YvrE